MVAAVVVGVAAPVAGRLATGVADRPLADLRATGHSRHGHLGLLAPQDPALPVDRCQRRNRQPMPSRLPHLAGLRRSRA